MGKCMSYRRLHGVALCLALDATPSATLAVTPLRDSYCDPCGGLLQAPVLFSRPTSTHLATGTAARA